MNKSIIFSILIFLICSSIAFSKSFGPNHDKVTKIFQRKAEPTAKDAVWTQKDIFKVGVINDGTNRNGYAQYIGEVLYDESFKGQKVGVQIIDILKLNNSGEWEKLGEARCK